MSGIYVHIPFCKQACNYCNFHFSTSLRLKNDFVAALLKEIDIQQEYLQGDLVETLYFGGGTPSLLEPDEMARILSKIQNAFSIHPQAEITLEANPDDILADKLGYWRSAGINRLSIGVQSFFPEDLLWMNRAHDPEQAINGILAAQDAGFDNLTVDLIYGIPGLSNDSWKKNVEQAIRMKIPHLSCYALTIEPRTALHKQISMKKKQDIIPDIQAAQFESLMDWTHAAGYEHYEISNFALPGRRSRHNSSYWQGKKYLGLGPSAHSYNGDTRQWNVSNNALYIQGINNQVMNFEREHLTTVQKFNEYVMVSLRTLEGCDLEFVQEHFGPRAASILEASSEPFLQNGTLSLEMHSLVLTRAGKLLADGIAAALFLEQL